MVLTITKFFHGSGVEKCILKFNYLLTIATDTSERIFTFSPLSVNF